MSAIQVWGIVTGAFFLALCIVVIWIFSDLELEFPDSERVDRSVKKQMGIFVLGCVALSLMILLAVAIQIDSVRYWVGAVCCVVAFYLLLDALRRLQRRGDESRGESRDVKLEEMRRLELSLTEYDKTKVVRSVGRLTQIPAAIALYVYLPGSAYLSLFDLIGLVLLLISVDAQFFAYSADLRKKLAMLKTELA